MKNKIIRLISTKIKKRLIKVDFVFHTATVHYKYCFSLEFKAFGLFWITLYTYYICVFNLEGENLHKQKK